MNTNQKLVWWFISLLPLFTVFLALKMLGVSNQNSILIAFPSWVVIYFFNVGTRFWIAVEPNHGVVLQNYFQNEIVPNDAQLPNNSSCESSNLSACTILSGRNYSIYIPNGQRSVFSGLHAKLPWEFPVADPISMVNETKYDGTISVQGKGDKFRYSVTYKCALRPLRSKYLPRYLMVEDEAAITYFRSHVESAIRKLFSEEDGDKICADDKVYSKTYLENAFGSNGVIVQAENYFGRFASTPFLIDVKVEKSGQDAAEVGSRASKLAAAVKTLTDQHVTPNVAAALLGGNKINLIEIDNRRIDPATVKKGKK